VKGAKAARGGDLSERGTGRNQGCGGEKKAGAAGLLARNVKGMGAELGE